MTNISPSSADPDTQQMQAWLSEIPETESVAGFVPGPGIHKLNLRFDIERLKEALDISLERTEFKGDLDSGFGAFSLTRRPGVEVETPNDLSGLFYTRVDDSYQEVPREEVVNEHAFTEFVPQFKGTYFEHVHSELTARFKIGRMRVLSKGLVQLQFLASRPGTTIAHSGDFQSGFPVSLSIIM